MKFENQEKKKTTSNEEVVSPSTPSAMDTSLINLGHIEVLQILNEYGYDSAYISKRNYSNIMAEEIKNNKLLNGKKTLLIQGKIAKDDFKIKQTMVSEIGSGNLSGKTYKGAIAGWGNLTGPEVLEHMMNKAGEVEGGFDPNTGFDYTQLISKFAMGAVFYKQAANNYICKKMKIRKKRNFGSMLSFEGCKGVTIL